MKIPVIDLHADTYLHHYYQAVQPWMKHLYVKRNHEFVPLSSQMMITPKRLKKGGIAIQTQSLFLDHAQLKAPLHSAMKTISLILQDCQTQKNLYHLTNKAQFLDNPNKTGIFISIEGLELIESDLDLLDVFHKLGVRIVAPTWNRIVPYLASIKENYGLFSEGKKLIQKMNQLNMILDVSHASEKSFFESLECIECPIIASHSNARSICNHPRNLTDEQLKALQEKKGVLGLNFYPGFLKPQRKYENTSYPEGFYWLYEMIDFIASKFSIDMIAFGSDFDGIEATPTGLENPECYQKLAVFLSEMGLSKTDIDKIFYKNAWRIIEQVL
jgi:membrane dipeptidase